MDALPGGVKKSEFSCRLLPLKNTKDKLPQCGQSQSDWKWKFDDEASTQPRGQESAPIQLWDPNTHVNLSESVF